MDLKAIAERNDPRDIPALVKEVTRLRDWVQRLSDLMRVETDMALRGEPVGGYEGYLIEGLRKHVAKVEEREAVSTYDTLRKAIADDRAERFKKAWEDAQKAALPFAAWAAIQPKEDTLNESLKRDAEDAEG